MKKISLLFLGGCMAFQVAAQKPQWACKLTSTNDATTGDFSAKQVLFVPDAMPSGQQSNGYTYVMAYSYEKVSSKNVPLMKFKVEYCTPIIAEQVAVLESFKPGSITRITIEDTKGKTKVIYKGKPAAVTEVSRIFYVPFDKSENPIKYVTIESSPGDVPGYNCIDAIALCPTKDPIDISINLGSDLNFVSKSQPLSQAINTTSSDILPIISPDGKTLYFDRKDHPSNTKHPDPAKAGNNNDDIYYSQKNAKGEWSEALNPGEPMNNYSHNFVNSISPDGNTMLLANTYNADGSPKGAGASITTRIAGQKWSVPEELKIEGFKNTNDYVSFFLTNTNRILLMSIENEESFGEKDIFMSFRKEDGTWVKPFNLGPDINTPQEEYSPVLASDNRTLYFASKGHIGFGSYDIFVTKRIGNSWNQWSKPVNLGPILNSSGGDLGFSIPASGHHVYTYRYTDDTYKSDIYVTELGEAKSIKPSPVYLISGRTFNAKTKQPISAIIIYETLPDGEKVGNANSSPDHGDYKIVLPVGKHYSYYALATDFIPIHENLEIPETSEYTELQKDLYLVPIEVGSVVPLNTVIFEQSKDVMLPSSNFELNRLAAILKLNPNIEFRIDGHTDNQGDAKKNMELSQQRVNVVKQYLVNSGISSKRITTKAFGGSKPIASNAKEETRKLNRRVEFTILKK